MNEYMSAVEEIFLPLIIIGLMAGSVLAVLGWSMMRAWLARRREPVEPGEEESRGYYPKRVRLSKQDVEELGTCPGGCSTGIPKLAYRGEENQAEIRTRWGKEMEESGAAPVKSAPEWIRVPGWPVKIEEIPDGIPLPEEPARVPMWKR